MAKRDGIYSSVDANGNIHYNGPLESTKGNHSHMTPRTDAYLPEANEPQVGMYDRGHITASSLSPHATNDETNIAPMHSDINRAGGAYYAMEDGQRTALANGASIHSEKTAFVNGQIGGKPSAFLVSDTITFESGQVDHVNLSFTNASYAEQQAWSEQTASMPGVFDGANPGDMGREALSNAEYAELMETTDAELPGLDMEYNPTDFSGVLDSAETSSASADVVADSDIASDDCGVDAGEADGGASADVD